MLTPHRLFVIRLRHYLIEQYKVWRQALDWTVWLYLLVPGLVIGIGLYREWWIEMPGWAVMVPWTLFPLPFFLYMSMSSLRTFTEEADKLFMLQRPRWLRCLWIYGMLYTGVKDMLVYALGFATILPFLVHILNLSMASLAWSLLFTGLVSILVKLVSHRIVAGRRGARKWLAAAAVTIVSGFIYIATLIAFAHEPMAIAVAALLVLPSLFTLICLRLASGGSFETDVMVEQNARMTSTSLLMIQVATPKPVVQLKRPLLFRHSGRLFRSSDSGTMLAEMRIKAFVRNWNVLFIWIGFMSSSSIALILLPAPAGLIMIAVFMMFGTYWISLHWKVWFEEPFVRQFAWTEKEQYRGKAISRFWMIAPLAAVWSLTVGFILYGIIGSVGIFALVIMLWYGGHRTGMKRVD